MTWTTLFWLIGAIFGGLFTFGAMRLWVYYLRVRTNELQMASKALDQYEKTNYN